MLPIAFLNPRDSADLVPKNDRDTDFVDREPRGVAFARIAAAHRVDAVGARARCARAATAGDAETAKSDMLLVFPGNKKILTRSGLQGTRKARFASGDANGGVGGLVRVANGRRATGGIEVARDVYSGALRNDAKGKK